MHCISCGVRLAPESNFCASCGTAVAAGTPVAAASVSAGAVPKPPGIGRLAFGLLVIPALFLYSTAYDLAGPPDKTGIRSVVLLAGYIPVLILLALRWRSIGYRGWGLAWFLVPPVALAIGAVAPAGYAESKRLDFRGKIAAGFVVAFVVLVIVLPLVLR
jgi:hypothetical protein